MRRRVVLSGLGAFATMLTLPGAAQASLARAVSLAELVKASSHVLHGLPLEASSHWETLGEQRRIVTYTRVRADETVAGDSPPSAEVMVRTLGGQVGDIGQVVHGEALLRIHEACLLFLHTNTDPSERVVAMAQGHYPILTDSAGVRRLGSSPNLPHLLGNAQSAVHALVGLSLERATGLVRAQH